MQLTQLTFFPRHSRITVRFRNRLYSSQVPRLTHRLLEILPHLAEHHCRNRGNLPFAEELKDTELGHVFEHVILALLSTRGIYTSGQTTWNWERDPIGTYHITVATGKRLAVKECVLASQAIFTNLLLGPPLKFRPISAKGSPRSKALSLSVTQGPERLLFSTQTEPSTFGKVLGR